MGWKGTMRSINANINRREKLAEKQQRYQQKQAARIAAYNVVTQQETLLEMLVSLHESCNANMNWDDIRNETTPLEPLIVTSRADIIQRKLDFFKPSFIDKCLKLTAWKKKRMDKKLYRAKEEDRKEYEVLFNDYQNKKNTWNNRQELAKRLGNSDRKVYIDIIKEYGDFVDIPLGEDLQFMVNDKNELAFDLKIFSKEEIIPDEEYSLRQSGTLSSKKMAKIKGFDIYQDHVCSCLLRVSREVFGLLPISTLQANALLNALNPQTGHLEDQVIISAEIRRETLETLNFIGIDPSDSFKNFIHNMIFTKSKGFNAVERLSTVFEGYKNKNLSMIIPKFEASFPSEDIMNKEQRAAYLCIAKSLSKGDFVDVRGNISYVFVYIYKLINQYDKLGFDSLHEHLTYLAELYAEEVKLSEYCRLWANDCLLGLDRFEEYLDKTEPKTPFGTSTHHSNLRLNIQSKLKLKLSSIDVLLMVGGRKSKFIVENQALYKDCLLNVLDTYAESRGGWLAIIKQKLPEQEKYPHFLFSGAPICGMPKLSFDIIAFYSVFELTDVLKNLAKDAENKARDIIGVPKIGEGWIAETQLFRILEAEFPQTNVLQHGSPQWLGRQHFDIWFPDWKIAVEYHGVQHFQPVDFFGGDAAFEKNVERDQRKLNLARRHGVTLFVVTVEDDISTLIKKIRKISANRKIIAPL
ncbi:MAG: hypothetical protein LEGION0403_FIIPPAGN_01786 [Legionella sp.]|uniref:hypothetical protein n=1 Tax=Legionella sp. TaxID=459 RepID=UPI003D0F8FC6